MTLMVLLFGHIRFFIESDMEDRHEIAVMLEEAIFRIEEMYFPMDLDESFDL